MRRSERLIDPWREPNNIPWCAQGEHGTGRNVASFVEMEWGAKATELMWELKGLFDPEFVLNPGEMQRQQRPLVGCAVLPCRGGWDQDACSLTPMHSTTRPAGVILNKDPDAHKKFLKPSPPASELVNRCIECGFCESNCPSRDITLTPRQRIATYKEIFRLRALTAPTAEEAARLKAFESGFEYDGKETCAADGMCQEKCPVKINTGELVKVGRWNGSHHHAPARHKPGGRPISPRDPTPFGLVLRRHCVRMKCPPTRAPYGRPTWWPKTSQASLATCPPS